MAIDICSDILTKHSPAGGNLKFKLLLSRKYLWAEEDNSEYNKP